MKILSFGGGVDSSAILTMHLMEKDLGIEEVIFADTGAESKKTYENVEFFKGLCADAGLPFTIVAKDGENITEWVTRLGIVPVMPGGSHVCSKKYKGDVIQKWIDTKYPDQEITYLIGIELDEGHRTERFTKPKGDKKGGGKGGKAKGLANGAEWWACEDPDCPLDLSLSSLLISLCLRLRESRLSAQERPNPGRNLPHASLQVVFWNFHLQPAPL